VGGVGAGRGAGERWGGKRGRRPPPINSPNKKITVGGLTRGRDPPMHIT